MKRPFKFGSLLLLIALQFVVAESAFAADPSPTSDLDEQLRAILVRYRFTGKVGMTLETRLGRPLNAPRVELGRALFFDKFVGLHGDNSCAGCHSPMNGFGDSQSIAIGVDNNGFVGPRRTGPRNQRRTPSIVNTAFYPKLMWNGRFRAISGDPFDNSAGFEFPAPEGTTRFPPGDQDFRHLLQAQAHIPPTELSETAGFTKVSDGILTLPRFQTKSIGGARLVKQPGEAKITTEFDFSAQTVAKVFSRNSPRTPEIPGIIDFDQFDVPPIGPTGVPLPPPQHVPRPEGGFDEFRNEPIRDVVLGRLNANEAYRNLFRGAFPDLGPDQPITFAMVGQAVAEFEFSYTLMNAPIDRYARGETKAMTTQQKQGAVLFFGRAGCVQCHVVSGQSNELFSDFKMHVAGIPQIAPRFGRGKGNVPFRDSHGQLATNGNQDFGLFDITEENLDTYRFRTSPLRNLAVQAAFFHNGAFTRLSDALRYHLRTLESAPNYDPVEAGVARDLVRNTGPIAPVLQRLDPALTPPRSLSSTEFASLLAFLREGLLDERARPENLVQAIPASVPSGLSLHVFETTPSGP